MAKRRHVLSAQEMTDIKTKIKTLESHVKHANARVDELEHGLDLIRERVADTARPTTVEALAQAVQELVAITVNPPVTARVEREEAEAEELALLEGN